MKIIILYGKQHCGKTTTLRKLKNILLKNGASETIIRDDTDFVSVFNYKNKTIGVCSGGDSEEIINENFTKVEKYSCDIIVCTSRTKGATVQCLIEKENNNNLIWLKKAYFYGSKNLYNLQPNYEQINQIQAEILFKEVNLHI